MQSEFGRLPCGCGAGSPALSLWRTIQMPAAGLAQTPGGAARSPTMRRAATGAQWRARSGCGRSDGRQGPPLGVCDAPVLHRRCSRGAQAPAGVCMSRTGNGAQRTLTMLPCSGEQACEAAGVAAQGAGSCNGISRPCVCRTACG